MICEHDSSTHAEHGFCFDVVQRFCRWFAQHSQVLRMRENRKEKRDHRRRPVFGVVLPR